MSERTEQTEPAERNDTEGEELNQYLRETIDDPEAWEDVTPDYSKPAAISLRLPTPLLARVRRLADERGIGYTSLMREWIEQRVAIEERGTHGDPGMPMIWSVASIENLASSVLTFRDVLQRSADDFQTRADLALTELSAAPLKEGRLLASKGGAAEAEPQEVPPPGQPKGRKAAVREAAPRKAREVAAEETKTRKAKGSRRSPAPR